MRLEAQSSPDIVVSVGEEFPEDIDCHHSESAVRFDLQHGENSLVEYRVSNILGGVGVCGHLVLLQHAQRLALRKANLSQYVVHRLAGLHIAPAQISQ